MRIFVNNVDSYVGKALCTDLHKNNDQETRLLGSMSSDDADMESMEGMNIERVISRSNHIQYLNDVLSCSLIVYDLHSANLDDVEKVIKHLKLAQLEHETVFVLISSVTVWARTKTEYEPIEEEEDGEDDAGDEDEGGEQIEKKKRPKRFTDKDLDRRTPSPACESWKYLETLVLSLCAKEKLKPYVVAAGILYGNGETVFNELFKAAWLTQPKHTIIHPGDNYIPCVHVCDVARLVKVVAFGEPQKIKNEDEEDEDADEPEEPVDPVGPIPNYLIAVDKGLLTQADIVNGIVNQMSNSREIPVLPAEEVHDEFKDIMTMDLIMEPSAPMRSSRFEWWCMNGLVANIKKVASEFCTWRNLRPIKVIILGPPGSGAERFCSMVAERYMHEDPPLLTFDQIVADAMDKETNSAKRLREKVEELAKSPGAKLPLKTRTRLVKTRLLSNVCRYRGYVLEGYPGTYEEAEALFTELVPAEGEEVAADEENGDEEEEEEEEEDPAPAAEADEENEEEEEKPQRALDKDVSPEFVIVLQSVDDRCKMRILNGEAYGATNEAEFSRKTAEYRRANLAEDGSPGTGDFFNEIAGLRVSHLDVDKNSDTEVFNAIRVYMESNGPFFNYLKSEEQLEAERRQEIELRERQEEERHQKEIKDRQTTEEGLRENSAGDEAFRRQEIANSEAALLESEAMPLRQYLLTNVVPTLSEGLSEVCKEQPDDPIEFLAQYLFAHAQDLAPNPANSAAAEKNPQAV